MEIETTREFDKAAKKILANDELIELFNHVITVAELGDKAPNTDRIRGAGGAMKTRKEYRGRGKSGGLRIIFYVREGRVAILLLDVFAKSSKANLSKSDVHKIREIIKNWQ